MYPAKAALSDLDFALSVLCGCRRIVEDVGGPTALDGDAERLGGALYYRPVEAGPSTVPRGGGSAARPAAPRLPAALCLDGRSPQGRETEAAGRVGHRD